MAQKGQKQERMLCGAVFAVCGLHIQGYWTLSLHLAAFCIMCFSPHRTSASCCSQSVALATPPASIPLWLIYNYSGSKCEISFITVQPSLDYIIVCILCYTLLKVWCSCLFTVFALYNPQVPIPMQCCQIQGYGAIPLYVETTHSKDFTT